MKNKKRDKMKKILILVILLLSISFVFAHQPRIVYKDDLSVPLEIQKPEVSQAFYGELKGSTEYYSISSDKEFNFYLGLLSPSIEEARTDFKAEISFGEESIILEKNEEWEEFYEEFAGDSYLNGPEIEFNASAGEYLIKVYNSDNQGKYVLVVGRIESFPLDETIKTYLALPSLKIYFEKSPLTAYFNLISIPLWIILFIVIIIIGVVFYIKRKKRRKK
jgi:hypothetical protein